MLNEELLQILIRKVDAQLLKAENRTRNQNMVDWTIAKVEVISLPVVLKIFKPENIQDSDAISSMFRGLFGFMDRLVDVLNYPHKEASVDT